MKTTNNLTPRTERDRRQALEEKNAQAVIAAIPVQVVVELARTRLTVEQITKLAVSDFIKLGSADNNPLDVMVGGRKIGSGEVTVIDDTCFIRITELVAPSERVHKGQ